MVVAQVSDSVQDVRNYGMSNGKSAVLLILNKAPGANFMQTVDTIRTSIKEVQRTLAIAFGPGIVVDLAFLRNVRAALLPAVAVPVSLAGTFGVMHLLGCSIGNLSLMAMTVATGFVVDDAIVVLENISRHIERGMAPKEAALLGKLAHLQGANLFLAPVQDIHIGGRQSNAAWQYTLQADELADLRTWEPRIQQALMQVPELANVNSDQQDKRVQNTNTPLAVNHQSGTPATTISFNRAPDVPLSDAVEAVNTTMARLDVPISVHGRFQGTAQAFQSSLKSQPLLIAAAIVTIYLVLGMLYESLIHPVTILSTLPSAGVGALLALLLFKTDFANIALIGVVLLIGIVKKNAIMMIDFALSAQRAATERGQDLSAGAAIYRAALLRLRPIMMTTMAAIFGAVPLALGTG